MEACGAVAGGSMNGYPYPRIIILSSSESTSCSSLSSCLPSSSKMLPLAPPPRAKRKGSFTCSLEEHAGPSKAHLLMRRKAFTEALIASSITVALGQVFTSKSHATEEISRIDAEEIDTIQTELRKLLKKSKAAGMLRLVFHDAGTFDATKHTGGMNGSIIFELDRPENSGLDRSIKILESVRASLGESLEVSWADLIAVAGAEGVALCGGPKIPIRLGRIDAVSSDPEGELPAETLDATSLKHIFSRKGFGTQEMVVLSGAHTIGRKGFGSPTVFDNSYFKVLLQKPWAEDGNEMGSMIGLPSDRTLVNDDECLRWVKYYANRQDKFFEDFSAAYIKLVDSGATWRREDI